MALELIGVALAIPPLIELTISNVRGVTSKIHTYKHAKGLHKDDFELHGIHAGQLDVCLEFLKDAAPALTIDLNNLLYKTLSRLTKSLDNALVTLERGIDKEGNVRRVWYTTLGRSAVRRDLDEVEKSQLLFQRAVQFAALFGGPRIAPLLTKDRLRSSSALARVQLLTDAIQGRLNGSGSTKMLLEPHQMPAGRRTRLPQSDIILIQSADPSGSPLALIESRTQATPDTRKVRDIARILNGTDSSMAMIRCDGFFPVPATYRCELPFPIPEHYSAQQLATAVLYVHTAKLVHKNIRPENIVILQANGDSTESDGKLGNQQEIGDLFLMGFDFARKEDEASSRSGDNEWYKNIYRHPTRQGMHLEVDFNMLHDIYSLGVVLLEIALWRSFTLVEERGDGGGSAVSKYVENRDACRFFDRKTKRLKDPYEIWKSFVKRAETTISQALGNRYRDTVLMCLKCLDDGFGDPSELVDQDGVVVGLVYIERVLATLDDIVV
ncbi:hypothetical protein ABW20_dc0109452 [Dactylellina cionopaga]|nr:hypothetical protein ABW20_dc0109452 [Dactylellina cionopaga]